MRLLQQPLRQIRILQRRLVLLPMPNRSVGLDRIGGLTAILALLRKEVIVRPDQVGIDYYRIRFHRLPIFQHYATCEASGIVCDCSNWGIEVELGPVGFGNIN